MADRVSATITLGPPFDVANQVDGQPLTFVAAEITWGRFDAIEACCPRLGLAYARWSVGCIGSFLLEREVFAGTGEPNGFLVTEHYELVSTYEHIRSAGSVAVITAEAERADAAIPPLVLVGNDKPDANEEEPAS